MTVTKSNQLWFKWSRCVDGYDWIEDADGYMNLTPKSQEFVSISPLVDDPTIFGQFSDLQTNEDYLKFANKFGLLFHPKESNISAEWKQYTHHMSLAFSAWEKRKSDGSIEALQTVMDLFNKRSTVGSISLNAGTVQLRIELVEKETIPTLFIEPNNLLLAIWAQFAHAVTHNLGQKRCKVEACGKWFSTQTLRRLYCSDPCEQGQYRINESLKKQKP